MYTHTAIMTGAAMTMSTLKSKAAPLAVEDIRPGGTCLPTKLSQTTSKMIDSTAQIAAIFFQCTVSPTVPRSGAGGAGLLWSFGAFVMRPS